MTNNSKSLTRYILRRLGFTVDLQKIRKPPPLVVLLLKTDNYNH